MNSGQNSTVNPADCPGSPLSVNVVKTVPITAADNGKMNVKLPKLNGGIYLVQAEFVPDDPATTTGSTSNYRFLFILF